MKKLFSLFLLLGVAWNILAANLELVKNGTPNAAIILSSKPTESAQMGAYELQHCVKLITGVTLPIRIEKAAEQVKIYIGDTAAARKAGLNADKFTGESYELKTVGNNLFLIGRDSPKFGKVNYQKYASFPRYHDAINGSLFATYDFLEERCGITFCGPWENSVAHPTQKDLTVKAINKKFSPPMTAFRCMYDDDRYYSIYPFSERERHLWFLRWRMSNSYAQANHNCYSIYYQYWDKAKSPYLANEFKQKRKELFAQGYEKTNSYHDAVIRNQYPKDPDLPPQLCFTNQDTAKHFAKEAEIYYNGKNVRGGWRNASGKVDPNKNLNPRVPGYPFYYPVESADSNLFCKCANCQALQKELTGDLKTSHLKFHFISNIAREAAKINPNLGISTLAYIQTLPYPHKLKLPENISVQLCLTQFAWWHPGIRQAQEKEYDLWIKNEAKKRPLTLWTYIFGPHWDGKRHHHYNNFPGMYPWQTGKMMKKFANDGIKGWFTEVELQHHLAEAYVAAKIAFNPNQDVNTVVDRWMKASYGDAAPVMKEIYKISENAYWNHKNYPQEWFKDPQKTQGPRGPHNPYWGTGLQSEYVNWGYGIKHFDAIEKLLAQAKKLVKTPTEKMQLQRFEGGIWDIARKGKAKYTLVMANKGNVKQMKMTPALVPDAQGDPQKINWNNIPAFKDWKYTKSGIKHPKDISLKTAVDKSYLYFSYTENDLNKENEDPNFYWGNCVELFFAAIPYPPVYQIAVNPEGVVYQYKNTVENDVSRNTPCDLNLKLINSKKGNTWTWQMAIPLNKLPLDQFGVGMTANFFRSLGKGKAAAWSPLFFTDFYRDGLAQYGRLYLPEVVYQENKFSKKPFVKDPNASNGFCAKMNGNHGWSLQSNLGNIERALYYADVTIRTNAKGDDKLTTRVGFYDQVARKILRVKPIAVKDISGDTYKTITIGPVKLSQDAFFYVGGFNQKVPEPNEVFVDKIVLRKIIKK